MVKNLPAMQETGVCLLLGRKAMTSLSQNRQGAGTATRRVGLLTTDLCPCSCCRLAPSERESWRALWLRPPGWFLCAAGEAPRRGRPRRRSRQPEATAVSLKVTVCV